MSGGDQNESAQKANPTIDLDFNAFHPCTRSEKIPFKAEMRVTKHGVSGDYNIYAMLRSGPTIKRQGVVKIKSGVKDLADFEVIRVADKAIDFEGGTLKAELVVGPWIEVTN